LLAGPEGGRPDFLVAGHAVQDLLTAADPGPWRLGGAASYASVLARNLGLRAAVLTACAPNLPLADLLPGIEVRAVASERTTAMRNVYDGGRRRQTSPRRAADIRAEHLPPAWRDIPIVLLGPVAGEIDDSLAACFPRSLVGAGAQGWLRETGPDGRVQPVRPSRWADEPVLRHVSALFLSDEDVMPQDAQDALDRWSGMVEVLCYTRGYGGADVCYRGEWRHIRAFPAGVVDLTGAGDTFATGFLVRYHETGDPWEAARFASAAASLVIEGEGIEGVPARDTIEARLRAHPGIVAPREGTRSPRRPG
jgi:sugar/nucleoside kinase (ribokinase family)